MRSFKLPDVDWNDPQNAYTGLRQLNSGVSYVQNRDANVDEESLDIRMRDGRLLELRIYRLGPFSANAEPMDKEIHKLPLILLFHGGHHVLGHLGMLSYLCSDLAKNLDAVVVSASYGLAPEHPFPTDVNDAWDILTWCAEKGPDALYADMTKGFIVGGVSSGGTLSVVLAHMARDRNLKPPITGLYLANASVHVPGGDAEKLPTVYKERYLSRSQDKCINSPVLPEKMVKLFETLYQPEKTSELYAPLLWKSGHADLPRTYTQICGIDLCRDENLILEDMLKKDGVQTRKDVYAGLPHAFWFVLPTLPQVEKWKSDTLAGFKWLLRRS